MYDGSQSFTFTKNVDRGFILCCTPPTQWTDSPIRWRCHLRVLCAVRRPVRALDCILLKDRNLALASRQGPEINSKLCLWVLPRPRHHTQCWLTNQHLILLVISCLETSKDSSGPTNFRAEPSLVSSSAISFPRTPACSGTQYSPTTCFVEISFNAFWHCWINGDVVLMALRAFKATIPESSAAYYFK